jgi:hypothetical protein
MAERVGFEPTCPLRDKTLSRRPRYDHFGTSPRWCNPVRRTGVRRAARRPAVAGPPNIGKHAIIAPRRVPVREVADCRRVPPPRSRSDP